jgi:hypothetical protein
MMLMAPPPKPRAKHAQRSVSIIRLAEPIRNVPRHTEDICSKKKTVTAPMIEIRAKMVEILWIFWKSIVITSLADKTKKY